MTKILGLDLGTNSIGFALIEKDKTNGTGKILAMGSRIVPMDSDLIKGFEEGNTITKAAARRQARGMRRNRQRFLLRRDRLVKSLKLLGWLPEDFRSGHRIEVSPKSLEEMHQLFGTEKIPSDWVNYFLRKKALSEQLTESELTRVLLQFNGRRGFKSNRKTENLDLPDEFLEEKWPKLEKGIEEVKVDSVKQELKADGKPELKRKKAVFTVVLNDGRTGELIRAKAPEWGTEKVELEINLKTTKNGEQSISFSEPDKSDWQKRKEAFEKELEKSGKHPGEFLLENLVSDPNFKVRNRVVTRSYYQAELEDILKEQAKHYSSLESETIRHDLAKLLYQNNKQKQNEIKNQAVAKTLVEDIIFYQRPLRSQKSSINKCRYETIKDVPDAEDGKLKEVGVNAAAVSSPLYQEFRIWQTIHNLKFYEREQKSTAESGEEKVVLDVEVTTNLLVNEAKEKLFKKFDSKEKIKQKEVLKVLGLDEKTHRWNYPEDVELKGNETKHYYRKVFKKHSYDGEPILNDLAKFERLWHLSFSVDDPVRLKEALVRHFSFPEKVAVHLALSQPFASNYGAFSTRAVKKLLSVMRVGSHWGFQEIHSSLQKRIQDLITAEDHPDLSIELRERLEELKTESDFQGLSTSVASYVVYGKHSESDDSKIASYQEVEDLILEQEELRNPIVTQMVNETLRLVADVWKEYGRPNHIHLELAREIQKSAQEKEKATNFINENRAKRERARALIREMNESKGNPNSKGDVDKLLLWEELAPAGKKEQFRDLKFKNPSEPTKAEIDAYRLWFDQGFRSPYSGRIIRFSDLFDKTKYDIDHIIPKTRFFDDSFANKVIVELELNRDKTNKTAYQYILEGSSKCPDLIKPGPYKALVESTFTGKKKKLLLSEDLPKGFVERQLVDTRHIGRKLNGLLSRVATHESDPVIVSGGRITDELKESWGLHELMKEVVKWRFERMEKMTGQPHVHKNPHGHLKLKGYSKRIDHRHHALDALVVACTTRSHIQYLNTLNATFDNEQRKQFRFLLQQVNGVVKSRKFKEPWPGFWKEAKEAMDDIVVSHKNRNRVLNKGVNWYRKFVEKDGKLVKENVRQKKGELWSARQPLSAGTNRGIVQIKEKKEVSLKEALKNVEYVSGSKIRKQLKKALELNKGKQSAVLKWIEENPVMGYDGQLQKQFWIVPKERRMWPIEEACWFVGSIINAEVKQKVNERWESCHRNEQLYRLSLEAEPLQNGQLISEVEIETYPLKSANRVGLLHNGQNSWTVKKLEKITDRNLSRKLIEHFENFEIDGKKGSGLAFSVEGIEAFEKNWGKPIDSLRIYEDIGNKYSLNGTYVETAKGTNLFFAVYEHQETKKRKYETIGLMTAMERRMQGLSPAPEIPEHRLVQVLSPNDTVYVSAEGEEVSTLDFSKTKELRGGFYKFVSSSTYQPYFLPITIADVIEKKVEFETMNKSERIVTDEGKGDMIKENFIKVNVNRIGQVQPIPEMS